MGKVSELLAPTLAFALFGLSGPCNIKAHSVDVKTVNGWTDLEGSDHDHQTRDRSRNDATGDREAAGSKPASDPT